MELDGKQIFVGVGHARRKLMPGAHQLVARKPGYVADTRALVLLPNHVDTQTVAPQPIRTLSQRSVRRWKSWKPWTVFGAGVLVAAMGIPLIVEAKRNADTFESGLKQRCPTGCLADMLTSSTLDARTRSHAENAAAIAMFSLGGVVAAGGVAMLVRNQPRIESVYQTGGTRAVLRPILAPGYYGLSLTVQR